MTAAVAKIQAETQASRLDLIVSAMTKLAETSHNPLVQSRASTLLVDLLHEQRVAAIGTADQASTRSIVSRTAIRSLDTRLAESQAIRLLTMYEQLGRLHAMSTGNDRALAASAVASLEAYGRTHDSELRARERAQGSNQ